GLGFLVDVLGAHGDSLPRRATGSSDRRRFLTGAVGANGETAGIVAVHRVRLRPRPAPELRRLVVLERLLDLVLGVHDERAVAGLRLGDRAALEEEHLGVADPLELEVAVGVDERTVLAGDLL